MIESLKSRVYKKDVLNRFDEREMLGNFVRSLLCVLVKVIDVVEARETSI